MGKIEQLVKSKLLGNDNPNNLVWPITKTQAVYDKTNTDLQTVLDSLGSEIQEIKEISNASVRYDQAQELTEEQKGTARTNIDAGTYSKPEEGIPASDLDSEIQTSLGKADTALQGVVLDWGQNGFDDISDIASAQTKQRKELIILKGSGLEEYLEEQGFRDYNEIDHLLVTNILYVQEEDVYYEIDAIGQSNGKTIALKIILERGGDEEYWSLQPTLQILEIQSNKVTTLTAQSTNTQYPSAKAVWDMVSSKYTKPSEGIPKSDLVMSIQESLEKLDNLSVEYGDSVPLDTQRPLCFVPLSILASSGFLDVEAVNDLPIFGGETAGMYLILQNYCAASNSVRYSSVHTMKHNQEDITYLVYALSTNGTWSFGYYEVPSGVIDEASNAEIDALFV